MHDIIAPIDPKLIMAELSADGCFLRKSNKGGTEIYVVDGRQAPNTMREIGRLREVSFRLAGGGTGLECDIDEFDLMDPPCKQLIVWNPEHQEIIGGYRFIIGDEIRLNPDGSPRIATSHIFNFSPRFMERILPNTMELGRSFVRPEYQSSKAGAKALYALDNLWDGLGALTVLRPEIKYLFGKVTMYPNYCEECRDMILYFMRKHFPDHDCLVTPKRPLQTNTRHDALAELFAGDTYKEDYKILNAEVRKRGLSIPPLVHAYMSLSPSMKMFGTAINDEFGDVEETGILIAVDEILEEKKYRHIHSFLADN